VLLPVIAALFLQVDPGALRPIYEQALERRRKEFGAADARTAQAARDLGLFLAGIGDAAAARTALAEAVRIDAELLGAGAAQTLADVAEIAALSPARQAEGFWLRAAASPDPAISVRALMSLGALRAAAGDRAGAAAQYRKALAKDEEVAGKDSPAAPSILSSLAEVVETREAIALLERALVVGRATQGAHHPASAAIEATLAGKLLAAGRNDEALGAAADALSIYQETLGIEHPRSARAMVTVGSVLEAQKQMERAERMYRMALDIDEGAYGPHHEETIADVRRLAKFLRDRRRVPEALELEKHLPPAGAPPHG
jgi:tetratricopeptide (TPR) repeat protein